MAKTTRFIGYCPCCASDFKVRGGELVHHGYKRPGYGFIVGDCFGAMRLPHETSPKLAEDFRESLKEMLRDDLEKLANLDAATELPKQVFKGYEGKDAVYEEVMVPKVDEPKDGYDWEGDREAAHKLYDAVKEWGATYRSYTHRLKAEIADLERDIKRLTGLIETWEKKSLTTREEEKSQANALKAERAAKKAEAKKARIDKTVAGYRKRIDSAVKNKNSNTLADIWESIQRGKLRDIDSDLTKEACLTLVDRAEVWAAFGLDGMTLSSWRTPGADDKILTRMKNRMDRFQSHVLMHFGTSPKDDWEVRRLTEMASEWPAELGGENKKGLKTLAEVRKILG